MERVNTLLGMVFSRLTVLSEEPKLRKRSPRRWLCKCVCGKQIVAIQANLRNGHTRSCGCLLRDFSSTNNLKHGKTGTPEFTTWVSMRGRCYNPNNHAFRDYGGRGITVCDSWRDSFEAFYSDMGPRPFPRASVDRIDNNGPYSPENCRWTDRLTQANNCRKNRFLSHDGLTLTLSQWAKRQGIRPGTLWMRLRRYGWDAKRALSPTT